MDKNKLKYPSLISFFKSFTKLEAIYMTFVVVLAIGMAIFFPDLMLESTASPLLLFCSVCNVIANPLVETMNAKQFRGNFIIDIFLIEITYIILAWHLGWYTLMLSCIFFWIPIDILSFIQWSGHVDNDDENVTVVKRLGWKKSIGLLIGCVVFCLVMGSIMSNMPGSQDSYLEAFATAMGMVNGTLLMLRYSEHWYAWVITTILYLAMDISAGAYGLLIDDIAMLVVTFYGIWKWFKYTKEHGTIQEKIDFRV